MNTLTDSFKKCARLIEPGSKRKWVALASFSLVLSVLEIVGAGLILILFRLVMQPNGIISLPVVGDINHLLPGATSDQRVTYAALIVAVFFTARGCLAVLQLYLQYRLVHKTGALLSYRLLAGYLAMPFADHQQENSARLIRNINESSYLMTNLVLVSLATLVSDAMLVVAMVGLLVVAQVLLTAAAGFILGGAVMLILRFTQPRLAAFGQLNQEETRACLQSLTQSFAGIRDVKLYGRERYFGRDFLEHRDSLARANYCSYTLSGVPRVAIEVLFVLFIVGALLVTQLTGGSSADKLPVLGLFAYSALRILPAVSRMLQSLTNVKYGEAALSFVHDDLQMLGGGPRLPDAGSQERRCPFEKSIVVDRVTFRYRASPEPALDSVSLTIDKGSSIGLVGHSGGGKSTLIDILVGLHDPTSGRVLVDGVDIHDDMRAWQANLGMVPQTVFLTDDTLRHNIAFGVDETDIDDGRIRSAVKMAQLDDFVATLPKGLDTFVGEAGTRLSGGQRQRVVIARALYRTPPILILDEGTSALDNLTEAQIIETLNRLKGRFTVIAVAHRLSSVRACDTIALIEQGRIVNVGSYEELSRTSDQFRRLAR